MGASRFHFNQSRCSVFFLADPVVLVVKAVMIFHLLLQSKIKHIIMLVKPRKMLYC
jgi:hypothetical protein